MIPLLKLFTTPKPLKAIAINTRDISPAPLGIKEYFD